MGHWVMGLANLIIPTVRDIFSKTVKLTELFQKHNYIKSELVNILN